MSTETNREPDQKEKLAELGILESKIEGLREKEVELEVDCITADTALEHTRLERVVGIDVETAAAIVLSLDRKRALVEERTRRHHHAEQKTQHFRAGLDALSSWRQADEISQEQGTSKVIKTVFMVATLVTVCAALAVHWAFLILLVPIGATSTMMWSGHDASWQRVGAKRRFEQTGLSPPADWTPQAVAELMKGLEELIEQTPQRVPSSAEGGGDSLEVVEQELTALLESAGLTLRTLDEQTERELRLVSRSFIARRELDEVKSALSRVGTEAEQVRTGIYRYLNRHGVGPGDGCADTPSLAAGLARLGDPPNDK